MHSLTIVQIYYSTMQNYLMVIHIAKKKYLIYLIPQGPLKKLKISGILNP